MTEQANLGLATTREMLEEIQVRAEVAGHTYLQVQMQVLVGTLDDEVLNYRTVDA